MITAFKCDFEMLRLKKKQATVFIEHAASLLNNM